LSNLLNRLARFCVLYHGLRGCSALSGIKMDPSFSAPHHLDPHRTQVGSGTRHSFFRRKAESGCDFFLLRPKPLFNPMRRRATRLLPKAPFCVVLRSIRNQLHTGVRGLFSSPRSTPACFTRSRWNPPNRLTVNLPRTWRYDSSRFWGQKRNSCSDVLFSDIGRCGLIRQAVSAEGNQNSRGIVQEFVELAIHLRASFPTNFLFSLARTLPLEQYGRAVTRRLSPS
jgi:hypothetical protein